jgi:CHASE3 domain sensor protein
MKSDSPFDSRFTAGLAIAVVLAFVMVATTWSLATESTHADERASRTSEALDAIAKIRFNTLSIEYNTQGFRFTGEQARLIERDAARLARKQALEQLSALEERQAIQLQRINALQEVIKVRSAIAERIEELVRTEGSQAANDFVRSVPLRETREQAYKILNELEVHERTTLTTERSAQYVARQNLKVAAFAMAVLLMLVLIATYSLIRRQISQLHEAQEVGCCWFRRHRPKLLKLPQTVSDLRTPALNACG